MKHQEDAQLRELLGEWKMAETLPPRFKEGVWRRIGQVSATPTAWELWRSWLESIFARKSVAVAYVTVLLLAGLSVGYVRGQASAQKMNSQMAAQYVQSLDPSWKGHE